VQQNQQQLLPLQAVMQQPHKEEAVVTAEVTEAEVAEEAAEASVTEAEEEAEEAEVVEEVVEDSVTRTTGLHLPSSED